MDEERYRVEEPEEETEEPKGFLRPLPKADEPAEVVQVGGKKVPIVNFLGFKMREDRRDLLVMFLIPIFTAIIDANMYSLVVVDILEESALYMFVVPILAAIPIGLVVSNTSRALFSALFAAVFFVFFFMLFLVSPVFIAPVYDPASFFISGLVVSSIYILFVILASLLGTLFGSIIREFF